MNERQDELYALAVRVTTGEGPDRELDGLAWAAVHGDKQVIIGHEIGPFPQTAIYGPASAIVEIEGFADYVGAPRYTGSIDAALSLVPKGWSWQAGHDAEEGHWARVFPEWADDDDNSLALAPTPARALTAAALYALVEQEA